MLVSVFTNSLLSFLTVTFLRASEDNVLTCCLSCAVSLGLNHQQMFFVHLNECEDLLLTGEVRRNNDIKDFIK